MVMNFVPVKGVLAPFDEECKEYLKKASKDDFIQVTVVKKRNPKFHRKYFAMLRDVSAQFDCKIDDLHDFIKDKLGRYDIVSFRGMVKKNYHTISFAGMDEFEFSEYYNGSIRVLAEFLGLEHDELLEELEAEYS